MTFLSAPLTAPPCGPETTCLRRLSAPPARSLVASAA